MKKRSIFNISILILMLSAVSRGVDPMYLLLSHQISSITGGNISATQYLTLTKPYAIWDSRPYMQNEIFFNGESIDAKSVPNLIWGIIGNGAYKLPLETISNAPTIFMHSIYNQRNTLIENGKKHKTEFLDFSKRIQKAERNIYVDQSSYQVRPYSRIDDYFRESNTYWIYKKLEKWPFFMTSETEMIQYKFSESDEAILNDMKKLGFYCVLKTHYHTVLIIDGMLDNSYGYIIGETPPSNETLGNLFNLCDSEKISNTLYLYTSN